MFVEVHETTELDTVVADMVLADMTGLYTVSAYNSFAIVLFISTSMTSISDWIVKVPKLEAAIKGSMEAIGMNSMG